MLDWVGEHEIVSEDVFLVDLDSDLCWEPWEGQFGGLLHDDDVDKRVVSVFVIKVVYFCYIMFIEGVLTDLVSSYNA